ncbi:heme o synthase [Undibacterium oligocarboniphilum]|uniref:Protoheme IX farnesyltransferase n=1 Tax=Undibacterium oligocarboniphilum TaxID=666702 RepID=A0A850QG48_9BURK|nr:heme o synthase [Undibacterium oligocarboniphilum]MBC3871044.1 protoheme IX farnesyltransferase [Undibacterium oligocarboniphilum]NVO76333.1 protoheme IX farnesyltransferase [Undibacterium oligocarboniphilum]
MTTTLRLPSNRFAQYWALTKPRVTQLAVFCAVIGMFLATPDLPDWRILIAATIGIWLLASAAFAVNCLVEREIDSRMARTARRATAAGEISALQTLVFSGVLGGMGMLVLYTLVNPLTMWLTFVTFVGYAVIYTVLLKPATPQNIVIGGLSGAMPPALGWAAVANDVPMQAWLLVLIIFVWTPPHFWALAMYRRDDYARSGLPMLPVTHGPEFTRFHIWLYTIALVATTMLPYAVHMSGLIYLISALILGGIFLWYAWQMYRHYNDILARKTFTYSIIYLSLLFAALLVDHYLK